MNKGKFFKHLLIYFLLIVGFLFLYVGDLEKMVYPPEDVVPQSNVNFVYQQF